MTCKRGKSVGSKRIEKYFRITTKQIRPTDELNDVTKTLSDIDLTSISNIAT